MMQSHKRLVESKKNLRIGNHRVEICENGMRKFIYFKTCICLVDDVNKTFFIDNGGWDTVSTNKAIGSYRSYFSMKGYREV